MKLGLFHFQLLYEVLERIHYIYDENELAQSVLQSISSALNAEGGTIFRRKQNGQLFPLASYGVGLDKLRNMEFEAGKGVVGWVVQHKQPVKVDNPKQDERFVGSVDVLTGFKTHTILAAPILAKGEIVGVIEFLNRKGGPFSIPDLEMVSMVGREVGIAFENATLIKELSTTRGFLNSLTDSLTAGILAVDQKENILRFNPSALKILEIKADPSKWMGHPASALLKSHPNFLGAIKKVISDKSSVYRQSLQEKINNKSKTIGYSGVPINNPQKERIGSALLFQDITAYAKK